MPNPYRPRSRRNIGRTSITTNMPRNLEETQRPSPVAGRCPRCGDVHADPDDALLHDLGDMLERRDPPPEVDVESPMPTLAVDLIAWITTPERARRASEAESRRAKPRATVLAHIERFVGG